MSVEVHCSQTVTGACTASWRDFKLDGRGCLRSEFCSSFADQNARRFLPEFMKPKGHRRSQVGTAWEWRPTLDPHYLAMNEKAAAQLAASTSGQPADTRAEMCTA